MSPDFGPELQECNQARDNAANPLHFSADAAAESDDRSRGQFRANLPRINGGFPAVREGLLQAFALYGAVAKMLAQFDDPAAAEITVEHMRIARIVSERACKLRLAGKTNKAVESVSASDGLVCA